MEELSERLKKYAIDLTLGRDSPRRFIILEKDREKFPEFYGSLVEVNKLMGKYGIYSLAFFKGKVVTELIYNADRLAPDVRGADLASLMRGNPEDWYRIREKMSKETNCMFL